MLCLQVFLGVEKNHLRVKRQVGFLNLNSIGDFFWGGSVSLTVYHCLVEFRQNDNFWISLNLNSIGDFLRDGFSSTKCLGFVGISY